MTSRVLIAGIGGIGGALARKLVLKGTAVHLVARSSEKLAVLKSELLTLSPNHHVTTSVADVALDADITRIASEASETSNGTPLTGFCYSVGSIPLKPLKSQTSKDFMDAYTLNVIGGAMLLKNLIPQLTAGPTPGSAVFFSSVAANVGFPNHTSIASAKGGVESFVRSAAAELTYKVRINCIAPSLTDSPLASRMTSNAAVKKALGEMHPIPRIGTSEDSANMAEFLLEEGSSGWITGQTFNVDGGRSTVRPKN